VRWSGDAACRVQWEKLRYALANEDRPTASGYGKFFSAQPELPPVARGTITQGSAVEYYLTISKEIRKMRYPTQNISNILLLAFLLYSALLHSYNANATDVRTIAGSCREFIATSDTNNISDKEQTILCMSYISAVLDMMGMACELYKKDKTLDGLRTFAVNRADISIKEAALYLFEHIGAEKRNETFWNSSAVVPIVIAIRQKEKSCK